MKRIIMFRKIVLSVIFVSSLSFGMSATVVQVASKDKLGCIKGLGVKRIQAIVAYRKTHNLSSLDELLNVKGIGKKILNNIKEDKQKKVCTHFTPPREKKSESIKKDIKAE